MQTKTSTPTPAVAMQTALVKTRGGKLCRAEIYGELECKVGESVFCRIEIREERQYLHDFATITRLIS